RLIPQIPGMTYATTHNEIYCSFYAGSSTTLNLESGEVDLKQITDYPYGETIKYEVTPEKNGQKFSMNLRIPTWTGRQFVPGELYYYVDEAVSSKEESGNWVIKVNGKKVKVNLDKGFAKIN